MKKLLFVLLAVLMTSASFAQFFQAPKVMDNNKAIHMLNSKTVAEEVRWGQIATPFVANDVYGNQVSLQSYLDAGKCVVVDYSCTWCGPCWNMHNSGLLEQIDALENVQVIWVEVESSNTTAQIFGPQGGSGYNDLTYGNWTVTATGDSIEYPIIDDDAQGSCLRTCYDLYQGYVPTIFFITPEGYYCDLNIENNLVSYTDVNGSMANIQALLASYPRTGDAPLAFINAPARVLAGGSANFVANTTSVDPISSIEWQFQGATPATATGATATATWSTPGTYTVTLAVTNANGTTTKTANIVVYEMGDDLSYVDGLEVDGSVGVGGGQIYWGVSFPASVLRENTYLTSVELYVGANYSGNYELSIYQGGENAPQSRVYSRTHLLSGSDTYQTLNISGSLPIDASKTLWIAFGTNGISYPASGVAYTGDFGSDWVSTDGSSWMHIQEANETLVYSWAIKGHVGNQGNASIETLTNNNVNLYPNPTTGILNINAEGVKEVKVMDVDGRVVMTENSNVIDMTNLNNGVYFVRVITAEGTTTSKIVKK